VTTTINGVPMNLGELGALAKATAKAMAEEYNYACTSLFVSKNIKHMTKQEGMNISLTSAAQLVSLKCGQPALSDVCNGLAAKENSAVFIPILTLAVMYMVLVKIGNNPVDPSQLGYAGDDGLGERKGNGQVEGQRAKWGGICPEINDAIASRLKFIKDTKLPVGTNVFPKISDGDVRSIINSAWRRIAEIDPKTSGAAKTLKARAMTEDVWKGQEDGANALSGRAAEYIKNNWSRGNGAWNPSQMKRQLLEELNSNDSADSRVGA